MRTILILLCFAFLAPVLGACATEEDYPVVIGDTTDGDDDVVIPADVIMPSADDPEPAELSGLSEYAPPSSGTTAKAYRDQVIQYCNEIQWAHYGRWACYQTYQNDVWLAGALQHCTNYVNNVVTDACIYQYGPSVYWQTRRAWNITQQRWFGDQFNWGCLGGWPVKTQPNDTDALHQAWVDCEPGV